jgi:hypothetical protein
MRAGVGLSRDEVAGVAGREAATAALAGVSGLPVALVFVFASHTHDLAELAETVQGIVGDAPVVGATGCGILVGGRFVGSPPHVIAEGVEIADQAAALREAGCHRFQGWLYAPALPAADLLPLLTRTEPVSPRRTAAIPRARAGSAITTGADA